MKYEFGFAILGIKETEVIEYEENTPIEEIQEEFREWVLNQIDSWMVPVREDDAP
jgi:hypothetical protein